MPRFLLAAAVPLVLLTSAASAQQGRDACSRDASRFCRTQLGEGDQMVLACLKEHRARLSKGCQQTLADHGQ